MPRALTSISAGAPQLGHGSQQVGAGQQTVTGTCVHSQRGTQRVTSYGTFLQTQSGTWMILV